MTATNETICAVGPRVVIRRYAREDVDSQRDWPEFPDPLLETYNLRIPPAGAEAYFRSLVNRPDYLRFAVDDEHGELLGTLSLREIEPDRSSARLGLVLRGDRLGCGYGAEVLRLFLGYHFDALGFGAMYLDVAANNERAIRLYEGLGFRWLGRHWQLAEIAAADAPRLTDFRRRPDLFRVQHGQVWVLHHDMSMTSDEYARVSAEW
jgi:RimJ/RimL family protein N-acetyltransferase